MKNERHKKILELINTNPISTQTELAQALTSCGYNVTQTTISRDIKLLELVKVLDNGTYRYSVSKKNVPMYHYQAAFSKSALSAECAGNIIVIKTIAGAATLAAKAIEATGDTDIVGTIAGYDTVFVCARTSDAALRVTKILNENISGK